MIERSIGDSVRARVPRNDGVDYENTCGCLERRTGRTRADDATERRTGNARVKTIRIVTTGIFAAMITVMTAYICHIPYGANGGYIHFGDTMIYLAAVFPSAALCTCGSGHRRRNSGSSDCTYVDAGDSYH